MFYTYIDGVIWYYIAVETDTVINLYFDYLSFTDVYRCVCSSTGPTIFLLDLFSGVKNEGAMQTALVLIAQPVHYHSSLLSSLYEGLASNI